MTVTGCGGSRDTASFAGTGHTLGALSAHSRVWLLARDRSNPPRCTLIVGCRRDPRFGPLVLLGIGGVYAEVLRDVVVALAPAEPEELEELIRSLRGASLLTGARGRAPVDVAAVARAASALSRLAAEHREIAEIEVNPLLATPDGAIGLDARVVLSTP